MVVPYIVFNFCKFKPGASVGERGVISSPRSQCFSPVWALCGAERPEGIFQLRIYPPIFGSLSPAELMTYYMRHGKKSGAEALGLVLIRLTHAGLKE